MSTMLARLSFNMGFAVGGAILGAVFIWTLALIFSGVEVVSLVKIQQSPA